MNNSGRNIVLWILALLFLVFMFKMFQGQSERVPELSYDQFISNIDSNNIERVIIRGDIVSVQTKDSRSFSTRIFHNDPQIIKKLTSSGARIEIKSDDDSGSLFSILIAWFPMLLLIGVWVFFLRQMQSGNNRAMGFGRSRAKLLTEHQKRITFDDVAGVEEAKEEVVEIVEFLKDPKKFQRLGGMIPKGVLLIGSPGTGKTLLARAIAGEANVPFFSISGSDFVEMFVGVGASRVRDMFEQAKKNAPCIVFIDEIDAVGRHRGAGLGGGNDEREQTLNQLLVEMDGFESNEGVILLAATNRPDVLDPALLRPGRFDRQVVVPLPDVNGREKILKVHMSKVALGPDADAMIIARGTPGFSGADLANLVNEAALLAARRNKRMVTLAELEEAKDKVMMGAERRSMAMSEEEKKITAYHEAGHALVGINQTASDPIHKATIIPRGRALGMVMRLPEQDRVSMTLEKLQADLAIAMGGRVAEELIFGKKRVTTGASSDIKHATDMARRMVTEWGLSELLGPIAYGENQQEVFLGHSVTQTKNISETTAQKIDQEVRRIVEEGYTEAKRILTAKRDQLEIIAKALLEYETLSGAEINDLITHGKAPSRPDNAKSVPLKRTSVPGSKSVVEPKKSKDIEGKRKSSPKAVESDPSKKRPKKVKTDTTTV